MMYNLPFFPHFYSRPLNTYPQNIYNNVNRSKKKSMSNYNYSNFNNLHKNNNLKKKYIQEKQYKNESNINSEKHDSFEENTIFEFLGIKLHSDDIILICLIFFLYNEGVKDEFLFIALILLLLS